jgi:M6 family metalloprotease-like protein
MSAIFGQTQTFGQENGPDVQLIVQGDEFYARYETVGGYTAVYDEMLGLYCYASLSDGEFVSTGLSIAKPPPDGLPQHLKEDGDIRNNKFNERFRISRPPHLAATPIVETFGPNKGLLEGRQINKGIVRGLTVLVNFQDIQTSVTAEEVSDFLNGDNYTTNGNYCSVREYYRLMSSGKLDFQNIVVGPITLSQKRGYYINTLLAKEALNQVVDLGIDLAQFDSKNEGILDAVSFLYAGEVVYKDYLWPHNFYLDWRHAGYRTNLYQISALGRKSSDLTIGTFCHESGHMLCRFPDLYDYGGRDGDFEQSAGIGVHCLMGAGNHNDRGRTPSPICAYLRFLADWCPEIVLLNKPAVVEAHHGAYDTVFRYRLWRKNEYFLVENRSRLGLDSACPADGLAVYHCDILGSNEHQTGLAARHYQCAVLQADGRYDLETNANRGDAGDFFTMTAGTALDANTQPSSRRWNGKPSGLRISDISAPGEIITFRVG